MKEIYSPYQIVKFQNATIYIKKDLTLEEHKKIKEWLDKVIYMNSLNEFCFRQFLEGLNIPYERK